MTKFNKFYLLPLLCLLSMSASAQSSGSSSSYSRYGLGTLNDQSQGFNKAMGGVGIGLRAGNRVNMINPASYSATDSVSFIFDVGMTGSFGNLKSGNTSLNVQNCTLDFVNAALRIRKGLGLSFGFVPYTTIGYEFTTKDRSIANDMTTTQNIATYSTFSGEGGLHQAYIGAGWKPIGDLSIGANVSFIWGNYSHSVVQTFKEGSSVSSNYSQMFKIYSADIRTYKIDLGVQYPITLSKQDWLTVGAIGSIGHKIPGTSELSYYSSTKDTITYQAKNAFDLPYTFGVGASWQHQNRLVVAADVKQEMWANCHVPMEGKGKYAAQTGAYKNRTRFNVGAQFTPDPFNKHYWKRMQYRAGANFSTPYLVVNGQDGPSEFGLSAGVGLPITNRFNDRPVVNVAVQYLRRAPSTTSLITENYLMLSLGLTFNESWFMKFKIK